MTTHPGPLPEHPHELVVDPDRARSAPSVDVDPQLVDGATAARPWYLDGPDDGSGDDGAGGGGGGDDGGSGEPARPRPSYRSLPVWGRVVVWAAGLALLWLVLGAALPTAPLWAWCWRAPSWAPPRG
jgi:hypothetical protein